MNAITPRHIAAVAAPSRANRATGDQGLSLADLPKLLAAAPHRLMFFAGAMAVMASMTWWAAFLVAGRFGLSFPESPIPAGWAHAVLTQYGMLSMFIFGFLLTVFPRWMSLPGFSQRHYVPVFLGVFGGYLLTHAGLLNARPLLIAGTAMMLAGWTFGVMVLGRFLWRHRVIERHAVSCYAALLLGWCGMIAFAALVLGGPWWLSTVAIKLGTFGLLVPMYFTVCHRMMPFFSANIVGPTYTVYRPTWSLWAIWILVLAHLGLELTHRYEWLWFVDVPMTTVLLGQWLAWQPWRCLRPGLLTVLYLAFAWLPIAFALFSLQSMVLWLTGDFLLGRAPVHALTVGYFGSMLVAMVTRVTQGHSGRPLQMGAVAWLTYALLQVVALTRITAEVAHDTPLWLVIAACGWLAAFLPWVARSAFIYLTPRADGQPG